LLILFVNDLPCIVLRPMRSIKFNLSEKSANAWDAAVMLVEAYFTRNLKADQVLNLLPDNFSGQRRASCQSLFLGALRHGHRSQSAFKPLLRKSPKPTVEAILLVAGYEFYSEPEERHPKIVHHAVERSGKLVNRFEKGFLNAILRKLPAAIASIDEATTPADFHSHPDWLVKRWLNEFGDERTHALLRWNQKIPGNTIRIYDENEQIPDFLSPTQWTGFYAISKSANWQEQIVPLLQARKAYVKDPSTRLAPTLLAPKPGMDVLDLCAAPGGKSFDLANHMQHSGRLVSADLPGNRIVRLKENLELLAQSGIKSRIVEADLLELSPGVFLAQDLPDAYDAVLLDAPCSNTGVIQRRTDVKWRLRPKDIKLCAQLQFELLNASAKFVKAGGKLTYSTCSIEKQENQDVVERFLDSESGTDFTLIESEISYPWETGHDGAGAFLFARNTG